MNLKPQSVLVILAIAFLWTPCFACQSGSRSSTPAPAASSSGIGSDSFAQSFSMPQNFSAQSFPGSQSVQQFDSPQANSTMNMGMPQAAGQGTGSPGVQSSALIDPIFEINDPYSSYTVNHSPWNCFLSKYLVTDVQDINRIHYGCVSAQDHAALKCYLQQLQSTDTRLLNRNEQLAFWFNLYNARIVDIVLDNYPVRSVRQIKQKFTDFVGPFDDEGAVHVLGKSLSLTDVESGIVRPVFKDPRVHYGLNCASFGCPNLASTAWTAENLEGRLNAAAYQYINSTRAVKRCLFGVRTTKIYKWYKADFGGTDEAVLNHIRQYADANTLNKLCGETEIKGYFYDWSLNDGKILRRRLLEPLIR